MSLSRQRPPCSWNYCGTCKHRRTRYPNSSQCKTCYDAEHGHWRPEGTKNAEKERARIVAFLVEQGAPELAELVRNRAYL